MRPILSYKAFIFDFDGTLVDTEDQHYRSFVIALGQIGLKYVSFKKHCEIYLGTGSKYIFKSILDKNNSKYSDITIKSLIEQKRNAYDEIVNKEGVTQIKGAEEFVLKAKEAGIKIAIVSGGLRDSIKLAFAKSKLPSVFEFIVSSEEVSKTKPDPEGFLLAAQKMEVQSEDVVVFEDATNGVEAARKGGFECVGLVTYLPESKLKAVYPEISLIKDFTLLNN